jgi:hypothetical protein
VVAAFRLLGGEGYARVDMRMDQEGQVNVIEVNPNPDISPGSGAILQAEGDTLTPMKFMFLSNIINIILDPIFIFGLRMNTSGAALATVLSQAIPASLVMLFGII